MDNAVAQLTSRSRDDPPVTVLLVGNRDIFHIGLRVTLEHEPWVARVLSAWRGSDAALIACRREPRVAVVDLFVGDEWGTKICSAIRSRSNSVRVLLASSSGLDHPTRRPLRRRLRLRHQGLPSTAAGGDRPRRR